MSDGDVVWSPRPPHDHSLAPCTRSPHQHTVHTGVELPAVHQGRHASTRPRREHSRASSAFLLRHNTSITNYKEKAEGYCKAPWSLLIPPASLEGRPRVTCQGYPKYTEAGQNYSWIFIICTLHQISGTYGRSEKCVHNF
jgi:hypothetical protein